MSAEWRQKFGFPLESCSCGILMMMKDELHKRNMLQLKHVRTLAGNNALVDFDDVEDKYVELTDTGAIIKTDHKQCIFVVDLFIYVINNDLTISFCLDKKIGLMVTEGDKKIIINEIKNTGISWLTMFIIAKYMGENTLSFEFMEGYCELLKEN